MALAIDPTRTYTASAVEETIREIFHGNDVRRNAVDRIRVLS